MSWKGTFLPSDENGKTPERPKLVRGRQGSFLLAARAGMPIQEWESRESRNGIFFFFLVVVSPRFFRELLLVFCHVLWPVLNGNFCYVDYFAYRPESTQNIGIGSSKRGTTVPGTNVTIGSFFIPNG